MRTTSYRIVQDESVCNSLPTSKKPHHDQRLRDVHARECDEIIGANGIELLVRRGKQLSLQHGILLVVKGGQSNVREGVGKAGVERSDGRPEVEQHERNYVSGEDGSDITKRFSPPGQNMATRIGNGLSAQSSQG